MSLLIGNPPGTESPRKRSRWHLPASTWHGIPAKAFQVSFPAVHLARNPRKSVPGVTSCRPPGTESSQKRSRWHFLPSTWHGFPARVFQVSLPAVHLARKPCESVPGGISPLPTCHGFPVKEFQVAPLVVHLARYHCESVSGGISLSSTWHGFPTKACQVSFPCRPPGTESSQKRSRWHFLPSTWQGIPAKAFQVASPCLPLATVSLRKRGRCHFSPSTWHGIPAKACQVSFPASHLARYHCESVSGGISLPPTCHGNIVPS